MGWGKNSQADSNGQDIMKQISLDILEDREKCARDLIIRREVRVSDARPQEKKQTIALLLHVVHAEASDDLCNHRLLQR